MFPFDDFFFIFFFVKRSRSEASPFSVGAEKRKQMVAFPEEGKFFPAEAGNFPFKRRQEKVIGSVRIPYLGGSW